MPGLRFGVDERVDTLAQRTVLGTRHVRELASDRTFTGTAVGDGTALVVVKPIDLSLQRGKLGVDLPHLGSTCRKFVKLGLHGFHPSVEGCADRLEVVKFARLFAQQIGFTRSLLDLALQLVAADGQVDE